MYSLNDKLGVIVPAVFQLLRAEVSYAAAKTKLTVFKMAKNAQLAIGEEKMAVLVRTL